MGSCRFPIASLPVPYLLLTYPVVACTRFVLFSALSFPTFLMVNNNDNDDNDNIDNQYHWCPSVITINIIIHKTAANSLVGTIPDELGCVTELQFINLRANRLGGTIPPKFDRLTKLTHLAVPYNDITAIPDFVGSLSMLDTLIMSNNNLSGVVPNGITTLTKLEVLALDDNALTGGIRLLSALTNLVSLYLEDNSFEDTLDATFLTSLSNLENLDLSDNKLDGVVPGHFFDPARFPLLYVLDLHGNELTSLPSTFPPGSAMAYLALHQNALGGTLSPSVSNLNNLAYLDLTNNQLTGPIPGDEIGSLSALTYLFLGSNNFTRGEIPYGFRNLGNLEDLSLKQTQRTGVIPTWFGLLHNMVLLDLDNNELVGALPLALANMRDLRYLQVSRNKLTGSIPQEDFGIFARLRKSLVHLEFRARHFRYWQSRFSFSGYRHRCGILTEAIEHSQGCDSPFVVVVVVLSFLLSFLLAFVFLL